MEKALQPLESHPVVHLHGDLKPEHLLVDGGGPTWKHAAFMQLVNSSATEWLGETLAPQADQSASPFEQKKEEARRLLAPRSGSCRPSRRLDSAAASHRTT
ncbi:hypothetical protein ABZ605_02915 [Streptomyces sp. NPDC012765]|uniref:hypothetical protein n=1 Tax=Streptomyces sp. NPDC012765 TaxID=3155249 RepID=UPI0033F1A37A